MVRLVSYFSTPAMVILEPRGRFSQKNQENLRFPRGACKLKGAQRHRYRRRKTPKMEEKRPRSPKNAMAGVEKHETRNGHLRNRSVLGGITRKTPKNTGKDQSTSKQANRLLTLLSRSPPPAAQRPPRFARKGLALAARRWGRATYLKASNLPKLSGRELLLCTWRRLRPPCHPAR